MLIRIFLKNNTKQKKQVCFKHVIIRVKYCYIKNNIK